MSDKESLDDILSRLRDTLLRIGEEGIGKLSDWVDSKNYPKEKLRSECVKAIAALLAVHFEIERGKHRGKARPEDIMELIVMAIDLGAYAATHDTGSVLSDKIPESVQEFIDELKRKNES